ncbi:MAG: hypothetical protein WAQ08_15905 [Aquabacterium sp.]
MSRSIQQRHVISAKLARVSLLNVQIVAMQARIVAADISQAEMTRLCEAIVAKANKITILLEQIRDLNGKSVSGGGLPQ